MTPPVQRLLSDLRTALEVVLDFYRAATGRSGYESQRPMPDSGRGSTGPGWNVTVFFLVFATMYSVAATLPVEREEFEKRTRYLVEHGASYDAVAIGSSRVMQGLPVKAFDAALKRQGVVQGATFNLGIQFSRKHHDFYTIRQLLDAGVRPRYLIVEASPFTSTLVDGRLHRFEVWHDLEETLRVLRTTMEEVDVPEGQGNRLERALVHLGYFLRRYGPLGKGWRWGSDERFDEGEAAFVSTGNGYHPLTKRHDFNDAAYARFRADPQLWEERLSDLNAFYEGGEYRRPVNLEAFRKLHRRVRDAGVQLVYVGMPHPYPAWIEPVMWLRAGGEVVDEPDGDLTPVLINLNTTERKYLRDLELRYDAGHTNNEGSRLVAEELAAEWVESFYPDAGRH